ncbi:hypothetical protein M011DRAFT_292399 [Sporormia fimetaria CBS 119925]|uniref:GPN-loop GTPase 2 n=1 Tax=Sporormia fimetaria CBS 119925 TaxID=1340428 RepID=A0A6A6UVV2_9PLEO|nr:hypothetical protein M011DRAFT_292399 [Sporormia fimetaria CBS 119925]
MLQMDLPHLNVLTKIDNLKNYPDLPFNLDFYTEVQDLNYLLPWLNREQTSGIPGPGRTRNHDKDGDEEMDMDADTEPASKYAALNKAIVQLVEDFALVGFETLAVEDKTSMLHLLRAIDRAGGYAFGTGPGANETVWQIAMREDAVTMDARDVQERWLDNRDEMDEAERKAWEKEIGYKPDLVEHAPQQPEAPAPEAKKRGQSGDDDDSDMEDVEEMKKMMKKNEDSGIKVVRKQKNEGS